MKRNENSKNFRIRKLIPGTFCKCTWCDIENEYCKKYKKIKDGFFGIGDYTWENYCLKNGGCDK